jgi:hypothetical protein
MTTKLSITMPDETAAAARSAAKAAGEPLSAWIAEAVRREAYRQGMAQDAAVIARHGLLDDEWAARQAAAIEATRGQSTR